MAEQSSKDAATTVVLDFADRHDLSAAQAKEILSLAGDDVRKADAFLEKARLKEARTADLRPPLSAEFT